MNAAPALAVELSAVIVAVTDGEPQVAVTAALALPTGPFGTGHRTLEQGLRAWVAAQGGLRLGYVEQLYTFADEDRTMRDGRRVVSVSYLALARDLAASADPPTGWYRHFPWEDRRHGVPPVTQPIMQALTRWKNAAPDAATRRARDERIAITFPKDPKRWNEELVLQRYELLWSAGLIEEARRGATSPVPPIPTGVALAHDHRRILATGIARLRAKIKYRPVVFELLPDRFTLLQLQSTVEALAGLRLHKQNFRRLVQGQGLVEEAKGHSADTRGRPAQLFAFRREVLRERAAAGTKLPRSG